LEDTAKPGASLERALVKQKSKSSNSGTNLPAVLIYLLSAVRPARQKCR